VAAEAAILNWRTYKRKDKKTRERLAGIAGSVKALRSALDKDHNNSFFTA
jgi:DNA-binding FrmR family transcriptional regulator